MAVFNFSQYLEQFRSRVLELVAIFTSPPPPAIFLPTPRYIQLVICSSGFLSHCFMLSHM